MRSELPSAEVERLFLGAADQALPADDLARLTAELAADPELRARYERYQQAIGALRAAPRERAPEGLATLVLRRTRRRRFGLRAAEHAHWRVPAEIILPLILAALVALAMFLNAP